MNITPVLLSKEAITQRFNISSYDIISVFDNERVLFFDGDTTIAGDLNADWTINILEALQENTSVDDVLIMINGNLTVDGDIHIGDYHPHMLVLGNVFCDVLISSDEYIHITGDAHIKYVYFGHYNDGSITVEGTTCVPYLLNSNHHSALEPNDAAVLINVYSDLDDFFEYDYTRGVLPQVIVPAAFDDKQEVDTWKLIDIIKSGQSPFNEGAKPLRTQYEEELERITSGHVATIEELDWSDKKLRAFPESIARLQQLKKLNLSKNNLREIPAIIGELTNLEELYIEGSTVQTIHEAIGNLKNLRVLSLNASYYLQALPDAIGNLSNLQVLKIDYLSAALPESLANLDKLEEVSMYKCYRDNDNPAPFPEALCKLKNLKRLDFRENLINELPESILNIQTLEVFKWTGSSTSSSSFPDFTQFKNLKTLAISKKFVAWKHRLFNITSLEHLEIDRCREERQQFDQRTLDLWEEMAPKEGAAFQKRIQWIKAHKREDREGFFSVQVLPGMQPEELHDIYKLEKLRYLDLSSNDLTYLPETFFQLKNLQYIDLRRNKFPDAFKERIVKAFPNTEIVWVK